MNDAQSSLSSWRKATASGQGNCVEVRKLGQTILVRNSKQPGLHVTFTWSEWEAFLIGARSGEFDPSLLPD